MSFTKGFLKHASVKDIIKSFGGGVKASGGETVSDVLTMRGFRHIQSALKQHKGVGQILSTKGGREAAAEAVGKAAPSIGAAALYAHGLNKAYNKLSRPHEGQQGVYYV